MVCTTCQRKTSTSLATPQVKRQAEIRTAAFGTLNSSGSGIGNANASGSSSSSASSASRATLANAGISKSKLLGKNAKNPYAAYGTKCKRCSGKTEQGKALCHMCAYKNSLCSVCGKSDNSAAVAKGKAGKAIIEGMKVSAK